MNSEIEEIVRLGEDSTREFKAIGIPGKRVAFPDAGEVADEIAAAANAAGAVFLFGVDNRTFKIEGVPIDKADIAERWIRDICNDSVKPPVAATIRKLAIADSGKCVLRVDVPKSLFVHEGAHGYFYRIGSSKRKMPPEMLARLFQQRSQTRLVCFDEQVVSSAETGELVRSLYSRFRTKLSPSNDAEFLRKLHLTASDQDGTIRPTVAGILFATEHPEEHLPSAYIQAVCYKGTERNADYQLDARDITGPLDVQIDEACRFVERNMRIGAVKRPARIDIPQYAMNAVFEAVVNAVAHRDYSISGAKIRLHMFSDRLELFSPGGLPNSMTLDEIEERQFARNELVCTCLSRCKIARRIENIRRTRIMDRRGEGVPVIFESTLKISGRKPEYRLLNDSELLVTFRSAPIDDREKLNEMVRSEAGIRENSKDRLEKLHGRTEMPDRKSGQKRRTEMPDRNAGHKLRTETSDRNAGQKQRTEATDKTGGRSVTDLLVALLRTTPGITQQELSSALGVARSTLNLRLAELKSIGAIRRVGPDRGGHWEVVCDTQEKRTRTQS